MKSWNKKIPKPKKGAWYVRVRGSYLPCHPMGWFLHVLLVLSVIGIFVAARNDPRSLPTAVISAMLEIVGLGALFSFIARSKS